MTTIAYDGSQLVADGQADMFDIIVSTTKKKIVTRGHTIYAMAGSRTLFAPVIDWLEAGGLKSGPSPKVDDEAWQCIMVGRDAAYYAATACEYPIQIQAPYAIGSGSQFAMAILRAGLGAKKAVEIAAQCDPWTGGEIQVVDIAEALGLAPAPGINGRRQVSHVDPTTGKRKIRVESV